ncbi:citrate lyase, alpha subunit [Kipferlia bialata]|uniref:Citrate lyase, alpha subunit n=1 Tax=Kipferlia bialata TaxID=797122 RepID=A0A9K3CYS6_9EUKA|nr:citrate lyase, alpha subunit [Kipferlia bialata]GIQ84980.1 citrate lyase, alpha subunit [Kipferlia bialata]|eukprot:g4007.t1
MSDDQFFVNAAGRRIPKYIPGYGDVVPFAGAFATEPPADGQLPATHRAHIKPGQSKMTATLEEALTNAGVADGNVISWHHHLRNGDFVGNMTMTAVEALGIKHIEVAPSSVHPVMAKTMIPMIKSGIIKKIHTGTNGPVGRLVSEGGLDESGVVVVRSHGGRVRAIRDGELKINIAVIAASACDLAGNCTGIIGPSACGPLAYASADSKFAQHVIVVTDNMVDFPCTPISIPGIYVDQIVVVDNIGDPKKITSTTMVIANTEPGISISRRAADTIVHSGYMKDGFSFQAGAGGPSLLSIKHITQAMRERGVTAGWANGGTTKLVVDAFHEGLIKKVTTCQAFDLHSIKSMAEDIPNHFETDIDQYANPFNGGCVCHHLDAVVLGALEVDVNFNINSNVRSNGYMMHNTGGSQDTAAGAKLCIVTCPTHRGNNPIICENVTCCTTPGECIDVIATELGICVNPRRTDLIECLSKVPELKMYTMEELLKVANENAGRSASAPATTDRIIGVIQWRDGTVIDVVYEVANKLTDAQMKLKSDVEITLTQKEEKAGKTTFEHIHAFEHPIMPAEEMAKLASDILEHFGLADAGLNMKIVDAGASDWVIAARVEAAVKAMFPEVEGEYLLPMCPQLAAREQKAKDHPLRRSLMYIPGDNAYMMGKAAEFTDCDCIIYDLEDAVVLSQKPAARILVRNALRAVPLSAHTEAQVRINQDQLGQDDLNCLIPHATLDTVCIPKIESVKQLKALTETMIARAPEGKAPWQIGLLESAVGVERAFDIAEYGADKLLVGLSMGLEDYSKDIGSVRTVEGEESRWAQARVHNAACAFQLQSFDSVFSDVQDAEGFTKHSVAMLNKGYCGQRLIHPSQIKLANAAYTPSAKQIAYAQQVKAAFDKADGGVVALGRKMIDAPVVARALRVIRMAKACGIIEE